MQSVFSKLAGMGVLALGLALIPATLPAQNNNGPSTSGNQSATAPARNQNGHAANTAGNDQNGNAANPNHPNRAAVPPAGTTANHGAYSGNDNGGGSGWGLWGLVGLLGLFGLARGRGRTSYVQPRDRDRDINDRRVA